MVAHRTRGGASHRFSAACAEISKSDWLGSTSLLPAARIETAMREEGLKAYRCFYTLPVTIWTFLTQVLGPDRCCRAAVAKLLATVSCLDVAGRTVLGVGRSQRSRVAHRGDDDVESDTGPYCKARDRLPVALLTRLARQAGADLHKRHPSGKLLNGRRIKRVDGTVASMPDTPENQARFPQAHAQKPGLGFPIMRLVMVVSMFGAAMLDMASGPYKGKGTGETALFRSLISGLDQGDVILADRYYASYWMIAMLHTRGVDCVMRQHQHRRVDFRRGQRLGHEDHIITIKKPKQLPDWMDPAAYDPLPEELTLREIRIRVGIKGFRVKSLVAVTTLLDAEVYPKAEIARALRCRWHIEVAGGISNWI